MIKRLMIIGVVISVLTGCADKVKVDIVDLNYILEYCSENGGVSNMTLRSWESEEFALNNVSIFCKDSAQYHIRVDDLAIKDINKRILGNNNG